MYRLLLVFMFAVALTGSVCGQGSIRFVPVPGYGLPSAELGSKPDELFVSVYTSLDLNLDGVVDLVFRNRQLEQEILPAGQNAVLVRPNPPPDQSRYASPLESGAVIGPSVVPNRTWSETIPSVFPFLPPQGITMVGCVGVDGGTVCLGDFLLREAYLGFRIQIDGQPHYGWMHLKNEVGTSYLHGYAYNTIPGQPILAGQVPEPSAWILILCGLVAGSLMVQRRRKFCSGRQGGL